jgi:sugar lactone lactonase YvrE
VLVSSDSGGGIFVWNGEWLDGLTGFGNGGYFDGLALEASFQYPAGLALDPDGSLLVADSMNGWVRRVRY